MCAKLLHLDQNLLLKNHKKHKELKSWSEWLSSALQDLKDDFTVGWAVQWHGPVLSVFRLALWQCLALQHFRICTEPLVDRLSTHLLGKLHCRDYRYGTQLWNWWDYRYGTQLWNWQKMEVRCTKVREKTGEAQNGKTEATIFIFYNCVICSVNV